MVRADLGVVIPTYFSPDVSAPLRRELLGAALTGLDAAVLWPNVLLVQDGAPWLDEDVAAVVGAVSGGQARVLRLEGNRGKGGAMLAGFAALLDRGLAWAAVLDCDGDHSPYDLPSLAALAAQVAEHRRTGLVEVVGRRTSRHGSLGWFRGELEGVTSRVVFSALRFALAREQGRTLDETWVAPYGEPDLEAGYRIYSREAASLLLERFPRAVEESGDPNLLRWGIEVVPTVEIALAGGIHAEGPRSTMTSQPTSTYMGDQGPEVVYATELRWIFRRCGVPAEAAWLMLEDALLRTDLMATEEGARLASEVTRLTLEGLPGGGEVLASSAPRPMRRV